MILFLPSLAVANSELCMRDSVSTFCMYSRMEGMEFFEGTEKLMEVWWSPVLRDDGTFADLRTVSR